MAHRAPRPSDTGAGAGRRPQEGGVTRLDEGGRYLGIPQNGGPAAPRTGSDDADAHNSGLLSVQETGCGTSRGRASRFTASVTRSWSNWTSGVRVRRVNWRSQVATVRAVGIRACQRSPGDRLFRPFRASPTRYRSPEGQQAGRILGAGLTPLL